LNARVAIALLPLALVGCSRPADGPTPKAAPAAAAMDPDRPLPSPIPDIVARVNGVAIGIGQILPMAKAALDKVSVAERDSRMPGILRRSLQEYIDRELLMQEALARGVQVGSADVDRAYDQMHRDHPDEAAWTAFLAGRAMDPQSLRAELRVQATVTTLLAQETRGSPVSEADARAAYDANPSAFAAPGSETPPPFDEVRGAVEAVVRAQKQGAIRESLLARLRAKARIEVYL
jgi:hypothetical protein